jgi:hypothetical protein
MCLRDDRGPTECAGRWPWGDHPLAPVRAAPVHERAPNEPQRAASRSRPPSYLCTLEVVLTIPRAIVVLVVSLLMPACGLDTFGLTNEPAVTTSGGLTTQEMPPGSTAVTATTGELSTEPTTLSSTDSGHSSGGASMGTTEGPTSSTGDGTTGQSGTTSPTTGSGTTAYGTTGSGTSTGVLETCGDGEINGNEQCDSDKLNGFTCEALGNAGGTLQCDPVTCTFDTSLCV